MPTPPSSAGVVIHLNSPDREVQAASLRTAANIANHSSPDIGLPVEVVVHGPAVEICLPEHELGTTVTELVEDGVAVAVCETALANHHIDRARLTRGVITVPSAVVELVQRQHQGWAYLRP